MPPGEWRASSRTRRDAAPAPAPAAPAAPAPAPVLVPGLSKRGARVRIPEGDGDAVSRTACRRAVADADSVCASASTCRANRARGDDVGGACAPNTWPRAAGEDRQRGEEATGLAAAWRANDPACGIGAGDPCIMKRMLCWESCMLNDARRGLAPATGDASQEGDAGASLGDAVAMALPHTAHTNARNVQEQSRTAHGEAARRLNLRDRASTCHANLSNARHRGFANSIKLLPRACDDRMILTWQNITFPLPTRIRVRHCVSSLQPPSSRPALVCWRHVAGCSSECAGGTRAVRAHDDSARRSRSHSPLRGRLFSVWQHTIHRCCSTWARLWAGLRVPHHENDSPLCSCVPMAARG